MLALTGVKSYLPNSFPIETVYFTNSVIGCQNKRSGSYCYLWCYRLIMIVQLIEQGQVVILIGSIIKDSRPFYWILLKEANLFTTLFTLSFHCCFGDGLLISSSILPKSYFHKICLISINQLLDFIVLTVAFQWNFPADDTHY